MAEKKRIAVIPGDGIGTEVIHEAVLILERLRETHGVEL
ncbi:MAG: tartrate dehydrogenase, partial [Pyrinomonadaceae bacterium]|nr:tartrate dehydrogenase [Pyrinomonadaceae bacterium]